VKKLAMAVEKKGVACFLLTIRLQLPSCLFNAVRLTRSFQCQEIKATSTFLEEYTAFTECLSPSYGAAHLRLNGGESAARMPLVVSALTCYRSFFRPKIWRENPALFHDS